MYTHPLENGKWREGIGTEQESAGPKVTKCPSYNIGIENSDPPITYWMHTISKKSRSLVTDSQWAAHKTILPSSPLTFVPLREGLVEGEGVLLPLQIQPRGIPFLQQPLGEGRHLGMGQDPALEALNGAHLLLEERVHLLRARGGGGVTGLDQCLQALTAHMLTILRHNVGQH